MTWFKRISLGLIGFFIILWLIILIFSPMAARIVLNDLMEADAIVLSEESVIRLNPFRSSISIDQLQLVKEDRTPLKLETLEVRYDLWRILFSEAHISRVYLKGLHLQAEMDEQKLIVAGFNLADRNSGDETVDPGQGAGTVEPAQDSLSPTEGSGGLAYAVPEVVFEDLHFDLSIQGQSHAVIFDEIFINRSIFKNQIADSELTAKGSVDGAAVTIEAVAHYETQGARVLLEFDLVGLDAQNYQYLLPETVGDLNTLADINITVELDRATDGHLSLEDAAAVIKLREFSYQDAQAQVVFDTLQFEADDIDLSLDAAGNLHTQVRFSTGLDQLDLSLTSGEQVQLEQFALDPSVINFVLKKEDEGSRLSLEDTTLALKLKTLNYRDSVMNAGFETLQFDASDIDFSLEPSNVLLTQAIFTTQLKGLSAHLNDSEDQLLGLEGLTLAKAQFGLEDGALTFSTPALKLNGLRGSQVNSKHLRQRLNAALEAAAADKPSTIEQDLGIPDELPPMLSLGHINFDTIAIESNRLSINAISVGGGNVEILLADTGELVTLADTTALTGGESTGEVEEVSTDAAATADEADNADGEASTDETANEPIQTESETPFVIQLQKIVLEEPIAINFVDESQRPKFTEKLFLDKLLVEGLDSGDQKKSATFNVSANDGKYFKLDVTGDAQPFGELVNANINAQVAEFSLPDVSPYLSQFLDFEFKAGQLDTDFQGSIVDSEIDAEAKLLIRAGDFSASQAESEETNVIGQAAIPLNVALGMLKDSDGNIELRLPVDGSLEDPSFGMEYIMGLVIQKAVMAQTKNYLMNAFVPYASVVSIAMAAGSYALKVRFEDLPYEAGQIAPGQQQQVFVEQLSQLMQDKPDLQVKLCPVVTPADLIAAQAAAEQAALAASTAPDTESAAAAEPATVPAATDELVQRNGPLTEDQKIRIMELATQRAIGFKDAVIQQGSIESSRLLLCAPTVELQPEGQPRMKFSV